MKRSVPLLAPLIVLGFVVWFVARHRPSLQPAPALEPAPGVSALGSGDVQLESSAGESPRKGAVVSPVYESNAASPEARVESASIRGRFRLHDGLPAAGVELSLATKTEFAMRALHPGLEADVLHHPVGASDADGRFETRFVPPRFGSVELRARAGGWAQEGWRFTDVAPGASIDVGDIELQPACVIRGRVVDSKGAPLAGWTVTAAKSRFNDDMSSLPAAPATGADGAFKIDGLPAGRYEMGAMVPNSAPTERQSVRVVPGEEAFVELRYAGLALDDRIVVMLNFDRTTSFMRGDWVEVALVTPGREDRRPARLNFEPPRCVFDGVGPGEHVIEQRDPRFRLARLEHVKPGSVVALEITGGASIALRVIDNATDLPVPRFTVQSRNQSMYGRGTVCTWLDDDEDRIGETLIEGVMSIDQTLLVRARGFAPCEIAIPAPLPGERRAIEARLTPAATIEGVVVASATREPIAGAGVRLARVPPPTAADRFSGNGRFEKGLMGSTRTDAAGRFAFADVGLGDHELAVSLDRVAEVRTPLVITAPEVVHVELEAPGVGRLVGRILAPAGTDFSALSVIVTPKDNSKQRGARGTTTGIDADGAFVTPWIEAGETRVSLQARRSRTSPANSNWSENRSTPIEIGTVTLAPHVDTVRDFDLRATFPSPVAVHAVIGARSAVGLEVFLHPLANPEQAFGATTDGYGRARVPAAPPGEYRVVVRDPDGSWMWLDERTLRVDPVLTAQHEVAIELVEVELTVRAGQPPQALARTGVLLGLASAAWAPPARVILDTAGTARVRIQLGKWTVRSQTSGRAKQPIESADLEITPAGPRSFAIDLSTPR